MHTLFNQPTIPQLIEKAHHDMEIKAEQSEPGILERIYSFCVDYIKALPIGATFLIEDIRVKAVEAGISADCSQRVWGSMPKKLKGFIEHAGYIKTSNKKAHGTPASLWRKVIN